MDLKTQERFEFVWNSLVIQQDQLRRGGDRTGRFAAVDRVTNPILVRCWSLSLVGYGLGVLCVVADGPLLRRFVFSGVALAKTNSAAATRISTANALD